MQIYKSLAMLLVFASSTAFAQKKYTPQTSVGMNIPFLIDNVVEMSVRHQFHRNFRIDGSLGGSPATRGIFANGTYNNSYDTAPPVYSQDGSTNYSYNPQNTSGAYGKVALSCIFNLPDFFYFAQEGALKFYVGPMFALSKYHQDGESIKTVYVYPKANPDGTIPQYTPTVTRSNVSESGTAFGSGFTTGFTIADHRSLSCDFGVDVLGFKRKSAFDSESHTIGLGTNLVIRINYNLGNK